MVNKKLLALSAVFLVLAVFIHFYEIRHPDPVAVDVAEIVGDMAELENAPLRYNIESNANENGVFYLNGWAFIEKRSTAVTNSLICVVGEDQNVYAFTTTKVQRIDVADAYGDSLYEGSGFAGTCNMVALPDDTYDVFLYVVDSQERSFVVQQLPYKVVCNNGIGEIKTI